MSENQYEDIEIRDFEDVDKSFLLADQIVMKNYMSLLDQLPIIPFDGVENKRASNHSRIFMIDKIVYDKNENNIQKMTNVYTALAANNANPVMIMHSDGQKLKFYMGICGEESKTLIYPKVNSLFNNIVGNFPGSLDEYLHLEKTNEQMEQIISQCFADSNTSISSVSGVASIRTAEIDDNERFSQGIEKVLETMRGKPFTAILIANVVSQTTLSNIQAEYELIHTSLVPFKQSTLTMNANDAKGVNVSLSKSLSETVGTNTSSALSTGTTESNAHTVGETKTHTDTLGVSAGMNLGSALSTGLSIAKSVTGTISAGVNSGVNLGPVHAGSSMGGSASYGKTTTKTEGLSNSKGFNVGVNYSHSYARAKSMSDTVTKGVSQTNTKTQGTSTAETDTTTTSQGIQTTYTTGKTLQVSYENKTISNLLDRIDQQLERIKSSESFGMFATAAYFIGPNEMITTMAASAYKSIISGKNTSVESSYINTWSDTESYNEITQYLRNLVHPQFVLDEKNSVTPASLVSGQEMALHMGFPKKSISGLSIIEMTPFGRNIFKLNNHRKDSTREVELGNLYHMGKVEESSISLDLESLSMHTFITGATGSGKSNAIYQILNELRKKGIKFLVIEPAKGEYKTVLGHEKDIQIYGTNAKKTELLRINPFRFPEDIHVLEHLDRLVEIFNVCWPMYAAMPAILKDAMERAYEVAGWNLETSENRYNNELFPVFSDVLDQIQAVLDESQYSADNKGDYVGALSTRVRSLTNGINGMIFTTDDLSDQELFDQNVIVDLSRVGSVETKALIMGILVMKLQEYRMSSSTGINCKLKHITVLEEAHNLLKKTSSEQNAESSNLMGKSVEMLANSIAEMRTYGEGFIIADQAPGLLDMAVIRNTNTKIILRLPDFSDRQLVGRASSLTDDQINELAKLNRGVASVYQNDWIEPVLCQVEHFKTEEVLYSNPSRYHKGAEELKKSLIETIMNNELKRKFERVDVQLLKSELPTPVKTGIYDFISSETFDKAAFGRIVSSLFNSDEIIKKTRGIESVNEWRNRALQLIDPPILSYSDHHKDLILVHILHQRSIQDIETRNLLQSFIERMDRGLQHGNI